jgi:hypothetical protein
MAAIAAGPDVAVKWMLGSLGLHEELAGAISEPIVAFLVAWSPTGPLVSGPARASLSIVRSAVAGTACVLTSRTTLVMVGACLTAIDPVVTLDALRDVNDADAVAARTLHPLDCRAHDVTPVSMLMSSSCSSGSAICSIIFVSISRTWPSAML